MVIRSIIIVVVQSFQPFMAKPAQLHLRPFSPNVILNAARGEAQNHEDDGRGVKDPDNVSV